MAKPRILTQTPVKVSLTVKNICVNNYVALDFYFRQCIFAFYYKI